MMQKVRVLVSAFFCLVWVVSFLFQLSPAVLFLLRYKFVLFYHLYLGGKNVLFYVGVCFVIYGWSFVLLWLG
uniref:Uncharacterized protein n=1 Tax=Anguilla anguilla TaxID=7936 RepID=A0A0E9TNP3_ANGAN